jgi:hypothetical protein
VNVKSALYLWSKDQEKRRWGLDSGKPASMIRSGPKFQERNVQKGLTHKDMTCDLNINN